MTRWILLAALAACEPQPSKLDRIVAPAATKPAPAAPTTFDPAAIDAWVGARIAERGAVGAALVVVKDGKTVLARGYGTRRIGDAAAIDENTPFAIGSISKQFTCAAIYALADQQKLALADPLAKYYPELPRAADITLADLGGHTSGYRDYYPLDYVDARLRAPIEPDRLIAEYTAHHDFAPGTRYTYSNTGFVILGRIVEKVTGTSYAQALAQLIFQPLGLASASLERPANAATGHVSLLVDPPEPAPLEADGWLFGIGDIWMSAADLARWDVAFSRGEVLSNAARRELATPRTLRDGRVTGYSCGFGVRTVNRETVLSHGGWVGGFWAHNAFVPRTASAVVLLTNDQHVDLGDLHERIVRLVTEDVSAIPAIAGPPAAEAARALIVQLQRGKLDRTLVGDDLAAYFDSPQFAAAAQRLRALGEPTVTLVSRRERGHMEVSSLTVKLGDATYSASMFRSPDGKIRQLLFTP